VIEPYETKKMVKSAVATDVGSIRVELADGRVQEITIENLASASEPLKVKLSETTSGQVVRSEAADATKPD